MSTKGSASAQGIPGMDPAVEKFAKMYCRKVSHPMMIVDNVLCCVYSSHPKLLPVGTLISVFVNEPVATPLVKEKDVLFIWKNVSYCARFTPIDKNYCFCELFDYSDIMSMAAFTDLYEKVTDRLCLFSECSDNIKRDYRKVLETEGSNIRLKNKSIDDAIIESDKLNSLLRCFEDYTYLALSNNQGDVLDLSAMIEWIVKEVNNVLVPYDRDIKYLVEPDSYFIYSDQRYAIIAFLNAVQNSLLYSPKDDEPVLSLTKSVKDETNYIVVQVINNIDAYVKKNSEEDFDFANRRCGLGLPAIKMFAKKANGEFSFTTSGSKAILRIMIPEYIPDEENGFIMESGGFSVYQYGEKSIVELMMDDVIAYVSGKRK